MQKKQKVNVLGATYSLTITSQNLEPRLADCDEFCDDTSREIVVEDYSFAHNPLDAKRDLTVQTKKVMRHEIVHAFLNESGLRENSPWARNEELVDWIAIQGPKLYAAWQKAGCAE